MFDISKEIHAYFLNSNVTSTSILHEVICLSNNTKDKIIKNMPGNKFCNLIFVPALFTFSCGKHFFISLDECQRRRWAIIVMGVENLTFRDLSHTRKYSHHDIPQKRLKKITRHHIPLYRLKKITHQHITWKRMKKITYFDIPIHRLNIPLYRLKKITHQHIPRKRMKKITYLDIPIHRLNKLTCIPNHTNG